MRTIHRSAVVALAAASIAVGASSGHAQASLPTIERARTQHVMIISIDGLRPDAIAEFEMPTLSRLVREGSSSMEAMTIFPSKTLPSHTSMLTGVTPEVHGILWNTHNAEQAAFVSAATVFDLAHDAGYTTSAFAAKAKLRHLFRPESLDYSQAPASNATNWMAPRTVTDAVSYLRHQRPNLMFVHVGEPDFAGHTLGWMSSVYGWAVGRADAAVARVLQAADNAFGEGGYTVIVTADHGGHDHTHGTNDPLDRMIPWIAWGEGVRAGEALLPGIRTMDTAATALWLLGVDVPESWAGEPVLAAFELTAPQSQPLVASY